MEEGGAQKKSKGTVKRVNPYKDQLMLSEWLVDLPVDFTANWTMLVCPLGRRCMVVASRGRTTAYTRKGYCLKRFPSHLPGGNHTHNAKFTILDCIFNEISEVCAPPPIGVCPSPYWCVPLPLLECAPPPTGVCPSPYWSVPLPLLECAPPPTGVCPSPYWSVPLPLQECAPPPTGVCPSPYRCVPLPLPVCAPPPTGVCPSPYRCVPLPLLVCAPPTGVCPPLPVCAPPPTGVCPSPYRCVPLPLPVCAPPPTGVCPSPYWSVPLPLPVCAPPPTGVCPSPYRCVPLPLPVCAPPPTGVCPSPYWCVPLPLLVCAPPPTRVCPSPYWCVPLPLQVFYVMDVMCWNSHTFYDSERDLRYFLLKSKFEEEKEALCKRSSRHPLLFELLLQYSCTKESLSEVFSQRWPVSVDGLLFFHLQGHYIRRHSPLCVWLKPGMLNDILKLQPSAAFLESSASADKHHHQTMES